MAKNEDLKGILDAESLYDRKARFLAVATLSVTPSVVKPSVREELLRVMKHTTVGFLWDSFQIMLAIIASGLYVASTYIHPSPRSFDILEIVFVTLFLVDYILHLFISNSRIRFIFKFRSIIDVLTILPLVLVGLGSDSSLIFFRIFRILRLFRILRIHRFMNFGYGVIDNDTIPQQAIVMTLSIFSLLFCAAGTFQIIENSFDRNTQDFGSLMPPSFTDEMDFFTALYCMVITVATVGYGDVVPRTSEGRLFVMVFVLAMMVLVPVQSGQLVRLVFQHSRFRGRYRGHPDHGHIVLSTPGSLETISFFLQDFFHPAFGSHKVSVAIMQEREPDLKAGMFLHKRRFRERVAYFTGNLSYEEDIARCDIRSAAAYFSLTSKASLDANMDDQNTLFRLFAIRSFDPTLEIFVQVTLPRTAMQIKALFGDHNMTEKCQASDVNVLCLKEMSLNILASNCLTPGIATLLSAWMRKERTIVADGLSWLAEYSYGLSNSMFSAKIPSSLKGRSFGDVCRILFTAFNVYSFAIVASSQSQRHAGHEILREPSIKESRSEPDFALLLTRKLHLLQSKKLADMQKKVDAIGSKARVVICPPLDTPVDEHDVVFLLGIDPAISVKISNLSAETVMKIDRELSEVVCTEVPNTPLSASSRGTASLRLVRRHSFTAVPYVTVPSFFLSDASSSESFRRNGSCFSTMDSRLISEPSDDLLAAGRFVRERLGCRLHPAAIAAEYYLLSQPRQFSDAFVTNYTGIGHVVISGDPTAIEHFVFPLRSKRCGAVVPIVILCNRKSIEEAERAVFGPIRGFSLPAVSSWWHQICVFPEIFVLEGCSAYTSDLDRCNFRAASHVVSFPSREDSIAHGGASDHFLERNSDFLPIITHHHVRIAGVSRAQMGMRSPQFVVEVCSAPSVRLLSAGCASHMVDAAHDDHLDNHGFGLHRHPKNSAVDDAFLSAEFASGRVLVDTIFDSMLVHSFFQTHTKDIFAQLLTRFGSSMSRDCEPLRLGDTMHNVVKVRVPETFHGQPFEALFHHSLMNGQGIPIGLMRPRGFMSASAEYVYGTPRRDSILHPDDSVFMFIRDLIGHPE